MTTEQGHRRDQPRAASKYSMLAAARTLTFLGALIVATIAAAEDYPVVDTGQISCYDDAGDEISCPAEGSTFYGQDAQFIRNAPSYTDNGDGTVSDNVTGLMWQQSPDDTSMSRQEAVGVCSELELAGYIDWRVPEIKELFSISDFSEGWPYLDTTYFHIAGPSVSKDEQYWATPYVGTTAEGGTNAAFGVNHGTGHIKAYAAGVSGPMGKYVRCVRGDAYGDNDFVDNGDGTVSDNATGLMWQQTDNDDTMNWEDALAFAEASTLAGYSDWRLPSVKELQSIVDYTKSPTAVDADDQGPAIDTDVFEISELPVGTTNQDPDYGYFWTSTSAYFGQNAPEYHYAWYVAFGTAPNTEGEDYHGAGAARFDGKTDSSVSGSGDAERVYNYVRLVRTAEFSLSGCAELGGEPIADRKVILKQAGESRVKVRTDDDGCFTAGPVVSGMKLKLRFYGPEVEAGQDELAVCFMLGESALAENGKMILKQSGKTTRRQWTDEIGCGVFEGLAEGVKFKLLLKVPAQ